MKRLLVVLAALCTAAALYAALPAVPQENTWVTNGQVYGMAAAGGKVYIGGEFTYVGPNTGSLSAIDAASGNLSGSFPRFDGIVYTIVSDGNGGWYVGGKFTRAGGLARNNAAHVLADGTVDPAWDPHPDLYVHAFAVVGSTVYVGGSFTNIGGQPRSCLASLDAATGAATGWNPSVNMAVRAFAVHGSTIVIGGIFSTVGGVPASHLAAYDTQSNTFRTFGNGDVAGAVYALAFDGDKLFAGGKFTTLGGTTCNGLAAVDMVSGNISAVGSGVDGSAAIVSVNSLVVSGGKLYVGGSFSTICGQARAGLAALNLSNMSVLTWDPAAIGTNNDNYLPGANSIVVNGTTVFVGGNFKEIGGERRNNLAVLEAANDQATGRATSWTAPTGGLVQSIASDGSTIYAGGDFSSVGGKQRGNIAAIDAATGRATDWDPQANGQVNGLAVYGNTVYAGGAFTAIGGQERVHIAAIDAATGQPSPWAPALDNYSYSGVVTTLLVRGDTLYAGGSFTKVGIQAQPYIASWNLTTGALNAWPGASPNDTVLGLAACGNTVYACGYFTKAGSTDRSYAASWDATSGALTDWDPAPNNWVFGFAVNGSTVYACGVFTTFGGQERQHLAAFNAETSALINWTPTVDGGTPCSIALDGATVYVGGEFSTVNGQPRAALAAIEAATGDVTDWAPGLAYPNQTVIASALAFYGSSLYVGGRFTNVGDGTRNSFAGFGQYTPLSVSGVSPASGALAGGTTVTVSGHSFRPGATVLIGDRPAAATCVNGTTLTAVVPVGASSGAKAVTVTNPDGDIATLAGGYTYGVTPVTPGDEPGTPIDPATGGTATITPPSGNITVTVPGGTFDRAVTLAVSTTTVPASQQSTILPSSIGLEITNNLGLQPSRPITIMAGYRNQDIPDLIERLLAIARWDNGRWVPIPSVVDTRTQTVTCRITHLSTFALVQLAPAPTLADVTAYPNPFDPKKGQCFFANLTADATVKLYTVAGELVRTLQPSSTGIIAWDGKNDGGSEVASGVYIAFIKSSAGDKKLKIAVQR